VLIVAGCEHQPQVQPQRAADDPYLNTPLHVSERIHVHFYDSSRTRAELEAGIAILDEDRRETSLGQGVTVRFFDRTTGEAAGTLTADSAMIDERSKDMVAIGNVVVHSDSSRTTLRTARLLWDQRTELIKTDEAVTITTPTETIHGQGLISDQYLTSYRLFKVRGVHQQ